MNEGGRLTRFSVLTTLLAFGLVMGGCDGDRDDPPRPPSSSSNSGGSGNSGGAGGDGGAAGGGAGANGGSGASGGAPSQVPICQVACTEAADCTIGSIPVFDENNWQCNNSVCTYLGCQSDDECDNGRVCRTQYGLPICVAPCSAPLDCAIRLPESAFACEDGGCRLLGCQSDTECSMQEAGTVCAPATLGVEPTCAPGCSSPEDCATGGEANDADNYACNGYCEYLGCNSDRECEADLGSNFECL